MIPAVNCGLHRHRLGVVLVLALLAPLASFAQSAGGISDAMVEARRMLADGKAQRAVETLQPFEAEGARLPRFNEIYGLACFEAGDYSEAVYAFRRQVAQEPKNAGARMDLARAYFGLGDYASAEEEFEALKALNPPRETEALIDQYLLALRRRGVGRDTLARAWLTAGGGHDGNANAATDVRTFAGFELDDKSRSTSSAFTELGAGASASALLVPRWRMLGTGSYSRRDYPDAEFVNTEVLLGRGAIQYATGPRVARVGVTAAAIDVDGEHNSSVLEANATLELPLAGRWATQLEARHSLLRHGRDLQVRDVDSTLVSFGLQRAIRIARGGLLGFGVLAARDDEVRPDGQFARDLFGLSLRLKTRVTRIVTLEPSLRWLDSEYDKPFFGVPRNDELLQLGLNADVELGNRGLWRLQPALTFADNDSSVTLFGYDRFTAAVRIRRHFE